MHVKFLETLDWSILIAYFLILIAIGIWASSKRKKGSIRSHGIKSAAPCGGRMSDLPC